MRIKICEGDLFFADLRTRIPFRYGIATMTHMPMVFLRLRVELDGVSSLGVAADILPPKWFTKQKDQSLTSEILEMVDVIDHARSSAVGMQASSAFRLWKEMYQAQMQWGSSRGMVPLLVNFGTSLVERALIEAMCRSLHTPCARLLQANVFGIELGEVHPDLRDLQPASLLPKEPLPTIIARHTVGLGDPLTENNIPAGERLDDGLPQSLEACIQRYGLKHFKIKLQGHWEADLDRLHRIATVLERHAPDGYAFSLDGNEQFESIELFRYFWDRLQDHGELKPFLTRLLFIEQPVRRQVALEPTIAESFKRWSGAAPVIIDESDDTLESLPKALELGYSGTSHKNCKGVFKGIINRCWLRYQQLQRPDAPWIMSGEDLCNIGPVALQHDLAVQAFLGIRSVERNGHHYNAGLSGFPASVQQQAFDAHRDLYERSPAGWPTLRLQRGHVQLGSINQAPFGVGFLLEINQFTPRAQWAWNSSSNSR